jgi:hypothetical protein
MNHRTAMLVVIVALAGCRTGQTTVPPPGTGAYQPPNQYYQPSAQPTFTPPTYGAPGAAVNPAPGFSSTAAPRPNVSLGSNASDGLAWQSVTRQPTIGNNATLVPNGTIHPKTTLTTVRGSGSPSTAGGLRSINDLPMVSTGVAPVNSPARAPAPFVATPTAGAPLTAPFFSPAPARTARAQPDPWRGR